MDEQFNSAAEDAPTMSQFFKMKDCRKARELYFFNAGLAKGRKEGMEKSAGIAAEHGLIDNPVVSEIYHAIRQAAQDGEGGAMSPATGITVTEENQQIAARPADRAAGGECCWKLMDGTYDTYNTGCGSVYQLYSSKAADHDGMPCCFCQQKVAIKESHE